MNAQTLLTWIRVVETIAVSTIAAMAIYILYLNRFRGKASDEVH
jgi:hypothetical protein